MNAANLPLPLLQTVLDGMEAHFCECLDRLREQEAELEVRRLHNATLFALLAQRDRQTGWHPRRADAGPGRAGGGAAVTFNQKHGERMADLALRAMAAGLEGSKLPNLGRLQVDELVVVNAVYDAARNWRAGASVERSR